MATTSAKPRIFLMQQRAYQTPVPPAEYEQGLLFLLKRGQEFDPIKLAEHLVNHGYTRVPRVTVKGEFTLRGEVLDVFMPGEQLAHRIVFDFDYIEQIKTFEPETQTSKDSLQNLVIYPMKEVVWTEDLVKKLEEKIVPFTNPWPINEAEGPGEPAAFGHSLTRISHPLRLLAHVRCVFLCERSHSSQCCPICALKAYIRL